jgi:cytochrome c-type biogenesis protein
MGEALLAGSALAAFLAGVVAFFAPCCAMVMLPTYLASATGSGRWRTAWLTFVFVAGVGTIVWPLTIGAAGLASLLSSQHEALFIVGGVVMLAVGWATLTGWMFSGAPALAGGSDRGGVLGVYTMGVFAGAATACCAPVLAGAVTIAGVSGTWAAGALLGVFYLFGLVTPLLLAGLGVEKLRGNLRDSHLALRFGGRTVATTLTRLISSLMFFALGIGVIVLALTGRAQDAPAAQQALGRWLNDFATRLVDVVPNGFGWAIVIALLTGTLVGGVRALRRPAGPREPVPAPSCHSHPSIRS